MLVVLSTAIGTIVGVTAGLLMINRKSRITPTGAHLAALQNGFSAGAPPAAGAPGVNLEDLRKLVVDRDDALRQSCEDLQKAQLQCEQARSEAQQESVQRAAAIERAQELAAQVAALTQQTAEWDARSKEQENLEARIVSLTAELSAAKHSSQEELDARSKEQEDLNARIAGLAAELSAAKHSSQQELDARSKEQEDLNARIASLAADLSAAKHSSQQDGSYRSSLEAQLTADREYVRQLTTQIADLQREVSNFETRLLEQRQLAAKGLEFLNLAQDNFAGVFRTFYNGAEAHGAETNGAEAHGAEAHSAEAHGAETNGAEAHGAEAHSAEAHRAEARVAAD
jgi:DNA repair exonuclease SbcCD ATPase subunit